MRSSSDRSHEQEHRHSHQLRGNRGPSLQQTRWLLQGIEK